MAQLSLPSVTLCAASSLNIEATMAALRNSMKQVDFAESILFTHAAPELVPRGVKVIRIPRLDSAADYSEFVVRGLADHVRTSHCLIVQWDGFVIDSSCWDPAFLKYDYVGAVWPQFDGPNNVGNGGFSLRSRRLLEAGRDGAIETCHPEDVVLCRVQRPRLEREYGIHFADASVAARFSFERERPPCSTFGFHGVFNMIPLLGASRFWEIYRGLDDRSTAYVDFRTIFRQLGDEPETANQRRLRLMLDRLSDLLRG